MLYWIPALFIIAELIFISYLDKIISYSNSQKLLVKYKDEKLDTYLKSKYKDIGGISIFTAIFLIVEFVYFVNGLFHSIWMISVAYITINILSTIISKLTKNEPIEKIIKRAKLIDFESSEIKFQRILKLNELNHTKIKTYEWTNYIYPTIKIFVFIAIIILHYHYKLL